MQRRQLWNEITTIIDFFQSGFYVYNISHIVLFFYHLFQNRLNAWNIQRWQSWGSERWKWLELISQYSNVS